ADEIAAWQDARSQGRSLGEHLAAQAELAVDPDDDDMLPAPSFGSRASQVIAWLHQHRWPVVGGGVAAAVAGAWFAVRVSGGEAEPPTPAVSHPATLAPTGPPAVRAIRNSPGAASPGTSPGAASPGAASPEAASPGPASPQTNPGAATAQTNPGAASAAPGTPASAA